MDLRTYILDFPRQSLEDIDYKQLYESLEILVTALSAVRRSDFILHGIQIDSDSGRLIAKTLAFISNRRYPAELHQKRNRNLAWNRNPFNSCGFFDSTPTEMEEESDMEADVTESELENVSGFPPPPTNTHPALNRPM